MMHFKQHRRSMCKMAVLSMAMALPFLYHFSSMSCSLQKIAEKLGTTEEKQPE